MSRIEITSILFLVFDIDVYIEYRIDEVFGHRYPCIIDYRNRIDWFLVIDINVYIEHRYRIDYFFCFRCRRTYRIPISLRLFFWVLVPMYISNIDILSIILISVCVSNIDIASIIFFGYRDRCICRISKSNR